MIRLILNVLGVGKKRRPIPTETKQRRRSAMRRLQVACTRAALLREATAKTSDERLHP